MESQIILGDCLTILPTLEECSVDSIVTDPPYELSSDGNASPNLIFLEFMFPKNSKVVTDAAGEDCFPFFVEKISALNCNGAIPTPAPAVPERTVALNDDSTDRNYNIENGGVSTIASSNGESSNHIETEGAEYIGCFALENTNSVAILDAFDAAGACFYSGGLGIRLPSFTASSPCLLHSRATVVITGNDILVSDNSGANFVGASLRTEEFAVLDFGDPTRPDERKFPTRRALSFFALLRSAGAKLIRALPSAGSLPTEFQSIRIRVVSDCTNRALTFDLLVTHVEIKNKGFMGKVWDGSKIAYDVALWREALRVLKPGGHLLAFGGTRTYHRMVVAIEDAGFQIRDTLSFMYGQGFPKSLNISKAIDREAGAEREICGEATKGGTGTGNAYGSITRPAPSTPSAKQWDGFGTALKPAQELICLARKTIAEKTIAQNVVKHGTGALNIDGCRIDYQSESDKQSSINSNHEESPSKATSIFDPLSGSKTFKRCGGSPLGRFPSNVYLDTEAARLLDIQSGDTKTSSGTWSRKAKYSWTSESDDQPDAQGYGDSGGASRFFYVAKTSPSERGEFNDHPTVKPIELMRHLVRLVTPPKGLVLDPFGGSGTTAIAAQMEGFRYIYIERDAHYFDIAQRRIAEIHPTLFD